MYALHITQQLEHVPPYYGRALQLPHMPFFFLHMPYIFFLHMPYICFCAYALYINILLNSLSMCLTIAGVLYNCLLANEESEKQVSVFSYYRMCSLTIECVLSMPRSRCSHACLTRMPYMYALCVSLYACLIRMPYMYAIILWYIG